MPFARNTIVLLFFISLATVTFGQIEINFKPQIIGQVPNPLTTNENVPITIELSNLLVVDLDDPYPNGFTLQLYEGNDYTFQGSTVTPKENYHGTLTVPVTVNDGQDDSKEFDFKIKVNEVHNVRPIITGQVPSPLHTTVGEKITIEFSHLIVVDPDNEYPEDFTLKISGGKNYDVDEHTVIPDPDFIGTLTVPVTVHDGEDESEKFNLKIEVTRPNIPPIITGQDELSTNEDQGITILLDNLNVTDPDNDYPNGFTLKIPQGNGNNYTVSGNTITPVGNFFGTLTVPGVTVSDGKDESNAFTLEIFVRAVNDAPVISGQTALSTYINTPITVQLSNLIVTDPDNEYPDGFTLKIASGFNYTVSGNTITPDPNFIGILRANAMVNDGATNSNSFEVQIRVIAAPNVAPLITGQTSEITITENRPPAPVQSLPILFSHLIVYDPDNTDYPTGFTLKVLNGAHYSVSGTTITPALNFTGLLSVRVTVNDGTASSNIFDLQVHVIPITSTPQIIGQKSLIIDEDESITIQLLDLFVSDADDQYPKGFTLQVLPGKDYTASDNTVTPALNLKGFLTVRVTVTDYDKNVSDPFNLAILINPLNDAPEITQFEDTPLSYEPGTGPAAVTSIFEVEDVDNDHLSFAEISIDSNYHKGYDELLFNDTANIRGVFDVNTGKLSLIGYATLAEYSEAIRSINYNYRLSEGESGNGPGILPGNKTIFLYVHDGQQASESRKRDIIMETAVLLDIPSAFTPNGEEPNETWNVEALSNAHQCDEAIIRVYNKRGLLLFQSIGLEKKWDGTFNGEVMPTDTYFYTIDLKLSYTKKTYKGVVTILR